MLPFQGLAASPTVQLCVRPCSTAFWSGRLLCAAAQGPHAASERSAKTLSVRVISPKTRSDGSAAIVGSSSMAFSLARAARPAEADGKPDVKPLPNKRPRCSDLIVQGPLPPQPKRQTTTADVEVCIYKFTDDAASVWDDVIPNNQI